MDDTSVDAAVVAEPASSAGEGPSAGAADRAGAPECQFLVFPGALTWSAPVRSAAGRVPGSRVVLDPARGTLAALAAGGAPVVAVVGPEESADVLREAGDAVGAVRGAVSAVAVIGEDPLPLVRAELLDAPDLEPVRWTGGEHAQEWLTARLIAARGRAVAKAGAREAEHCRRAYGSYVDPTLRAALRTETGAVDLRQQEVAVCVWDITGYSAVAENPVTQPDLVDAVQRFFTMAVRAINGHGGIVHKFLGDGVIAVFPADREYRGGAGSPAESAVAAASRLREDFRRERNAERPTGDARVWLADLRCGVHLGDVHYGQLDVGEMSLIALLGHDVNVAARISGTSTEDRIVTSTRVRDAAGRAFDLTPYRSQQVLKNVSRPYDLWAVTGERDTSR